MSENRIKCVDDSSSDESSTDDETIERRIEACKIDIENIKEDIKEVIKEDIQGWSISFNRILIMETSKITQGD